MYDLKVEVSIGIKVERATEYIKASIHYFQTEYEFFTPIDIINFSILRMNIALLSAVIHISDKI